MRAPHRRSRAARTATRGFTLLETVVAIAITGTMAAVALPSLLAGVEEFRVASAARYLAGRLQGARLQAVRRSAAVAVRFQTDVSGIRYASFVDGNHNGVRTVDISAGVDRRLTEEERAAYYEEHRDDDSLFSHRPVDVGVKRGAKATTVFSVRISGAELTRIGEAARARGLTQHLSFLLIVKIRDCQPGLGCIIPERCTVRRSAAKLGHFWFAPSAALVQPVLVDRE